jgi:hypothetical protein
MSIIGSAGLIIDASQDANASQDSEKDVLQDASQDVAQDFELSVFPNPSNGEGLTMTLSGITSSNLQVRIYDALGRKIQSERYAVEGTLQTELNFESELSDGIYMIEVSSGNKIKTARILVTK